MTMTREEISKIRKSSNSRRMTKSERREQLERELCYFAYSPMTLVEVREYATKIEALFARQLDDLEEARRALLEVPDPADEGRCDECSIERGQDGFLKWPALTTDYSKGYRRDYFLHSPDCWYGKVQRALGEE